MVTGLKSNETSSVMEPHSHLCQQKLLCGFITLLILLLFKPVTAGQHPYMQLISVLCVPASITFFFKKFLPLFQSFFQLNNSTVTPYNVSMGACGVYIVQLDLRKFNSHCKLIVGGA